jgi:succinate dehydrogenase / fumarate reductase cytochrome b subunit
MSLAGLFLITFLLVHLAINSLILFDPSRELFNVGAHFMMTNPIIQAFQWVLFAGFLIHIIFGVILQIQNWLARPKGYMKKATSEQSFFSKFMIHTGVLIFVFLVIHFVNFFFVSKGLIGEMQEIQYGNFIYEDLGAIVIALFQNGGYVIFYVVALLILGFHLDHAFQSAFQSLGLSNPKYTPFIKGLGHVLAIFISVGYILIPLVIYFNK